MNASRKKLIFTLSNFKNLFLPQNLDVLIVGCPWLQTKNGLNHISKNHPLREELFSIEEIIKLIEKNNIQKTVIVHIEEMWRLSYDDYKKLEKKYKKFNIIFGFDGMKITV